MAQILDSDAKSEAEQAVPTEPLGCQLQEGQSQTSPEANQSQAPPDQLDLLGEDDVRPPSLRTRLVERRAKQQKSSKATCQAKEHAV